MKNRFLQGAFILTLAGFIVKILGSFNRFILSRLLGGEGIGLYQMAYPVYMLLLSVAAAGVPVAVSILVAEKAADRDYFGARNIFHTTIVVLGIFGLAASVFLYYLAGFLVDTGLLRDSRAYTALVALTPAVLCSGVLAGFRGYFQGFQLMTPSAVSQVAEQFVRVLSMLFFAWYLFPYGLEYAAAGAAFGSVPGSITGLLVLLAFYIFKREDIKKLCAKGDISLAAAFEGFKENPVKELSFSGILTTAKRLVLLAVPVSLANIMLPLSAAVDMLLVPNRLGAAGFAVGDSTALFGYLAGMAQPLILLCTIPAVSIATSLVPALAKEVAEEEGKNVGIKLRQAFRMCFLITVPAAVGMYLLADPIATVLYGIKESAPVIAVLAPSVVFLGLFQISSGALQGIGKINVPMFSMFCGIFVKIGLLYYLTAVPEWNIYGAVWATNMNFLLSAVINIVFLQFYAGGFFSYDFLKIVPASLLMGIAALFSFNFVHGYCGNFLSLAVAITVAVAVYAVAVIVCGCIDRKELEEVSFLKKFVKK